MKEATKMSRKMKVTSEEVKEEADEEEKGGDGLEISRKRGRRISSR